MTTMSRRLAILLTVFLVAGCGQSAPSPIAAKAPTHAARAFQADDPGPLLAALDAIEGGQFESVDTQAEKPSLPPVAERVEAVLAAIDFSKPEVVLWIPGTSEHFIHPAFQRDVTALFGRPAVLVDYMANWKFLDSVPDGEAVLKGVLAGIARRGERKVYIAGQSQGSWIASTVIADPVYGAQVERAAFFGHPSVSAHHAHGLEGRVLEINNAGDIAATPTGEDPKRIINAIDGLARKKLRKDDAIFLKLLVKRPGLLGTLIRGQMYRVLGNLTPDPHVYAADMATGAIFLKTGARTGRATLKPNRDGITPRQ